MQQATSPSAARRDLAGKEQQQLRRQQQQQQQQQLQHHQQPLQQQQQQQPQGLVDSQDDSLVATDSSPAADSPATRTDVGDANSASPAGAAAAASAVNRRRKTGQGSRGVANLTPEQLAKKRANDREAQRNIRERTKAQIENLERTIEQLKSQQPYQELQRVLREKEAVEGELAEVKRVLSSILTLIQPHLAGPVDTRAATAGDLSLDAAAAAAAAARVSQPHHSTTVLGPPLPPPPPSSALGPSSVPRAGYHHEHFMQPADVNAAQLSASSSTYSMPWQLQSANSPASQTQPPAFAPRPRSPNGQPTLLGMASSIYRMTDSEQEALTMFRLGGEQRGATTAAAAAEGGMRGSPARGAFHGFAPTTGSGGLTPGSLDENSPPWLRLPLNRNATCTLDTIVLTFLAEVEKRVSQGVDLLQAAGSEEPDWRFIANPDAVEPGQQHLIGPLSRFFGQVLSNRMFPDLQSPPEKVGSAWLLYTTTFWQITRRKEDFDRIPEWLRPGKAQLTVPHGPWVDAMFWPGMRDAVLISPQDYVFDELFVPLTRTVSCNWPYGEAEIFDTQGKQIRISRRFLQHIRKLENWTLGPEFAQAYPKLAGTFHLRVDE